MSSEPRVFIGRQPILDAAERVVAYELLYRASAESLCAEITAPDAAAARVIANAFAAVGADAILGDCLGFFNVTTAVFKSDVLEALPADRVVIEILENVEADREIERRCRALKRAGFRLALDDYVVDDPRAGMLDLVDLVKVDLMGVPDAALPRLTRGLRRHDVKLLAEKVETRESFERCRALGYDYFQGFFFARPVVIEGASIDPARAVLLDLIGKLQTEASTEEIVHVMKRHVNLGLNLLRLVNSAALSKPVQIERIEDAVRYIGRRHLQRWVTILLFAGDETDGLGSPLLLEAAHRGRLMESLIGAMLDDADAVQAERAFLVGMLSYLEALLGRPREEVVPGLSLHTDVEAALLKGEGALGQLLELARHVSTAGSVELGSRVAELGIDWSDLCRAQDEAVLWVRDLQRG